MRHCFDPIICLLWQEGGEQHPPWEKLRTIFIYDPTIVVEDVADIEVHEAHRSDVTDTGTRGREPSIGKDVVVVSEAAPCESDWYLFHLAIAICACNEHALNLSHA